jgi:hypothetical protein
MSRLEKSSLAQAQADAHRRFLLALWAQARPVRRAFRARRPIPLPLPFATRRFELAGVPHELACWLDGPHPQGCAWWEDLSVWVVLRRVPVARPRTRRAASRLKTA